MYPCSALVLTAAAFLTGTASAAFPENVSARVALEAGYDANVYRLDVGDLGKRGSWTLGLRPVVEWRPLDRLFLSYTGDLALFIDESGEDNLRHTLVLRLSEPERFTARTAMTRVQGPRDAVEFADGRNAWATTLVRERRDQWQNRTSLQGMLRQGDFYARPVASLVYFDLDSRVRGGVPGYDNWINRYDLQGGFDLGRELEAGEVYLGLRRGRQHQGDQGGRPSSRSNNYHRVFLGFSGEPVAALTLDAEVGPSFHRYDDPASVGPSSIDAWYVSARARAGLSARDTVSAGASMSKAVASTGLLSSESRSFSADYVRRFAEGGSVRIHGGARGLVYDGRPIKDWMFTGGVALAWPLSQNLDFGLDFLYEEGRDRAPPRNAAREFTRSTVSAGMEYRF